jgi:hypothetical protein
MKKLLLVVSTVLALVACSEQKELTEIEAMAAKSEYYVNSTQAENVASSFLLNRVSNNTKALAETKDYKVKNSFTVDDEAGIPFINVINYENGGFVIVSGDKRLLPILAYSENGYFDNNIKNYPDGLVDWIGIIKENIQYLRNKNEEIPPELAACWKKYTSSIITKSITPPGGPCDNLVDVSVGPLLTTSWTQGSTYNALLPSVTNGPGGHANVGCVPLAISQIMKYFQYPNNYQWSQMPNDAASYQTQILIRDVFNKIDSLGMLTYNANSTPVNTSFSISSFLKNQFGYSTASEESFDRWTTFNYILNSEKPIIMLGQVRVKFGNEYYYIGHAWVCDGAHEWDECIIQDNGDYSVVGHALFHMNWGWGTSYNGWFGYDNGFTTLSPSGTYTLSYQLKVINCINP